MFNLRYSSYLAALSLWTICDTLKVGVNAQSNGTCVCQPGEIQFTLDFALACENRTIMSGVQGIEEERCVVTHSGGLMVFDDVPVSVSSVTVAEIDFDLNVLRMVNYTDAFVSGDTISYVAFSVSDTGAVANGTIPNGLQVAITGSNAANEVIINNVVILFTNDCTIYPVLDTDSSIGWVSLTTVTGPPAEFCPAFTPPESDVPSSFPSSAPSIDLCACQPGALTFTFDYALTCEDRTIVTGAPGIDETECLVSSRGDLTVSDPVPVSIESIVIFELDASNDLNILSVTNMTGPFASGDEIKYESFAVSNTDEVVAGQIPRVLQVTLQGFNAAGDDLTQAYVIVYTNECNVYPVLTAGSTIGWTSLSMVTGPPDGLCPAFDAISTVPSVVPSSVPVQSTMPSVVPSGVPIALETIVPSIVPSNVPVESNVPSIVPSGVPIATETILPSATILPVPSATLSPSITRVPIMAETESPTLTPVVPPVSTPPATAPIEPPVMAPIEPPAMVPVPTCPPIGGKGGKGKGGKGKGDSGRLLRTGGGVDECPEPPMMKKSKGKDNMSMDIKKKKGMKMPKADKENKEKGATSAPTSKKAQTGKGAPTSKAMSNEGLAKHGKGKGGDGSGKGKMGKEKGTKKDAKGDKVSKKTTGMKDDKVPKKTTGMKTDETRTRQLR